MSHVENSICFRAYMGVSEDSAHRIWCVHDSTCHLTVPHVSIWKSFSNLFGFPIHVTVCMKRRHLRAINTPERPSRHEKILIMPVEWADERRCGKHQIGEVKANEQKMQNGIGQTNKKRKKCKLSRPENSSQ